MTNPTASMLVIGDEILSGRTRDANMFHLAQELVPIGIDLLEVRVVPDDGPKIAASVNELRSKYSHVFTSGGIGPTHDDITAENIAAAFGVAIEINADARAALATNYPNGAADLNPARLRMARIPIGAKLIDNPISRAPGFTLENVHVLAGVPEIFRAMLRTLLPQLAGGNAVHSATVTVLQPEGDVAGPLADIARAFPGVSIGSYPFRTDGGLGTNIVVRSQDSRLVDEAKNVVARRFGAQQA